MMRSHAILLVLLISAMSGSAQFPLRYEEGHSLTYEESTAAYRELEEEFLKGRLEAAGESDCGRPIYTFSIGQPDNGRPTVLINNGIHPGESCGVDASLKWMEELLSTDSPLLDKVNIVIITLYNVGGSLNRGCCTRANQDGPTEQGFRGNARNLDLNRDFIKMDSRNAETFVKVFQRWKPEILVDTHTSNGADYRHTLTLIHSQLDMISPHLKVSYEHSLLPYLYAQMEGSYPMIPYMNLKGRTPESGIVEFPDWPRYSTGYAALFNCFGFTTEAHMLKPFKDRVMATYHFLKALGEYAEENPTQLVMNKKMADRQDRKLLEMPLDFTLDTTRVDTVRIMGYAHEMKTSEVTGLDRLYYDHTRPVTIDLPEWSHYLPMDEVSIPEYYMVPQAWRQVLDRLKMNGVEMSRLENDSLVEVEVYYIDDLKSPPSPYEGHFLHSEITSRSEKQTIRFLAGDYLIPTDQNARRYLVNVLEPRAKDSFFAWNFFDEILQQKEYFSPYVFEDMAEELLKKDEQLSKEFKKKKEDEPDFAQNAMWQLFYIYQRSPYYEKSHRRYPVFRL